MGGILNHLFWQVWNMSVTAGWCIAGILILRLVFRNMPRKYLYALWLVAAFRLICPVSVSTDVSLFNLEKLSKTVWTEETGAGGILREETAAEDQTEGLLLEQQTGTGRVQIGASGQEGFSLNKFVLRSLLYREGWALLFLGMAPYLWAAGVLAFLVYFLVSAYRLRRRIGRAVLAPESTARSGPGFLKGASCPVYECDSLASPFAMGLFRPRIYLPCHLKGAQREMVLLHEQYHIRRKDHLVKLLAFSLLAVYWFHPMVWAAWFFMCKDMEMSCDEKVLELLGEERKKEYGMTLLSCAVSGPNSRMPLAFGEQDVESRIRHALSFRRPTVLVGVLSVCVLVAALALFCTNGKEAETGAVDGISEEAKSGAELLYEARNPYVGNAPADGTLSKVIGEVLPDSAFARYPRTMELQTSEEPYEYGYVVSSVLLDQPTFWEMAAPATLMMALTDNLGVVNWKYRVMMDGKENSVFSMWDLSDAEEWCQVDDLKAYGASPEKLQELLDILEELRRTDTRLDVDRIMALMEELDESETGQWEVTEDGRDETLQQ